MNDEMYYLDEESIGNMNNDLTIVHDHQLLLLHDLNKKVLKVLFVFSFIRYLPPPWCFFICINIDLVKIQIQFFFKQFLQVLLLLEE